MESYKKSISSTALLAALLISTTAPSAHAFVCQKSLTAASGLGLFASACLLHLRRSVKDFKPRYSAKKLTDVKNALTKEYFENIWYLFYDGFVGQKGKQKIKLKGEAGEKLELSSTEEADHYGVLGTVDALTRPFEDSVKTAVAVFVGCKVALKMNGDADWFREFLWNKAEDKVKKSGQSNGSTQENAPVKQQPAQPEQPEAPAKK